MKLFKKKIIIYRETSFLSDRPNKYFFSLRIFGLQLADIESLFWLKFYKSKSIWFISCCHSNCILRRKKLLWWWFDDYEVQLFIWEMSPPLHSLDGVTLTLSHTLGELVFLSLHIQTLLRCWEKWACEEFEISSFCYKFCHLTTSAVQFWCIYQLMKKYAIYVKLEYSTLIDIFRSRRKFSWDGSEDCL